MRRKSSPAPGVVEALAAYVAEAKSHHPDDRGWQSFLDARYGRLFEGESIILAGRNLPLGHRPHWADPDDWLRVDPDGSIHPSSMEEFVVDPFPSSRPR